MGSRGVRIEIGNVAANDRGLLTVINLESCRINIFEEQFGTDIEDVPVEDTCTAALHKTWSCALKLPILPQSM